MGIIERLASFAGYERRDASACIEPSWAALEQNIGLTPALSARAAENLSAVLCCVNSIATALSYVPALVFRRGATGDRTELPNHPLAQLVRDGVNQSMTWVDWVELMYASVLLQGNALSTVERDPGGQIVGLTFRPWGSVTVAELVSGRLAFDISDGRGRAQRFLGSEVIHLKDRSDDAKVGRSRLSRAAETISAVHGAASLSGSLLRNGAFPSGVLTAPGAINNDTAERLKATWSTSFSGDRAGKIAVAGDGLKWERLQISPEDAELLESRRFNVAEVCRVFGVPPQFAMDYSSSTFTNSETAGRWFAMYTLSPWARKLEAEFSRTVFPTGSGLELELDLSGFQRADPEGRWRTYQIAKSEGILTVDEIRQLEGFGPMPKGQTP